MYYLMTLWIDWFYNRVIHYDKDPQKKVPMPGNYDSRSGWIGRIELLTGLDPSQVMDYAVFGWLDPLHQVLFVYDMPKHS